MKYKGEQIVDGFNGGDGRRGSPYNILKGYFFGHSNSHLSDISHADTLDVGRRTVVDVNVWLFRDSTI